MRDDIYEENGKWCYNEWLEPESRGWVTHSFDTKEQAEAFRDGRENTGLAKIDSENTQALNVVFDALESAYEVFSDKRFTDRYGNAAECKEALTALHEYMKELAGGGVERVEGLADAIGFMEVELALRINPRMPQSLISMYIEKLLEAARLQLKRQEG